MSFKHKKYGNRTEMFKYSWNLKCKKNLLRELEHTKKGLCILEFFQEMRPVFDGETHDHLRKQDYIIE